MNSTRRKPIHLTEQELWAVAVYCIENKCVGVDQEGKFTRFRMFMTDIVKECRDLIGKDISEYHIKNSMKFFNDVNELTKLVPKVPAQESVQEEVLKIEVQKLKVQLAAKEERIDRLVALMSGYIVNYEKITKSFVSDVGAINGISQKVR